MCSSPRRRPAPICSSLRRCRLLKSRPLFLRRRRLLTSPSPRARQQFAALPEAPTLLTNARQRRPRRGYRCPRLRSHRRPLLPVLRRP
uniref:Uncharacterized protein n=1 Tax=Arundo donax TaxID=35708 RepID=A0A0A9BFI6_ARUDO